MTGMRFVLQKGKIMKPVFSVSGRASRGVMCELPPGGYPPLQARKYEDGRVCLSPIPGLTAGDGTATVRWPSG